METAVREPIELDTEGVARIRGTTTKVSEVVLNKEWAGQTPEELQRDMPYLTLGQVYAAMDYYHQHKEELDAEIERGDQFADMLREESGESPFVKRMRAAGKLP